MEAAWGFPQWILTSTFKRVVKWLLKRQAAKVTLSAAMQALFDVICIQNCSHIVYQRVHLSLMYGNWRYQACSQLSNDASS